MLRSIDRMIATARMLSWTVDPRAWCQPPAYPIDRPIFLLGTQGGGLTLLSRMLGRNADVISAAGNHRYWTSADELQNVYGLILPESLTGLRYKVPHDPELPGTRSWSYACDKLLPKYRRRACDASPELAQALQRVIRLAAWRHAIDKYHFRFVDKSQTFTVRLGLVNELLRSASPRFILVPRDPYVSVLRAAMGKAADMKRFAATMTWTKRVQLCAEHYGNSMRAALEDADMGNIDLHILRFEDLLARPEESLRAVCHFADIEFCRDMLPSADHRLPLGSRFRDRWFPLRAEVNQAYESMLDACTIVHVNERCGDTMARLGYSMKPVTDRQVRAA